MLTLTDTVFAQSCTKTVRWFDDPPYSFKDTNGEVKGLSVEIARTALQQLGCEAVMVELPWARALIELKEGRLDILGGALRKPDREQYAYFSIPVNRSPNVLFIGANAAKKFRINLLEDLIGTNFRLGAQNNVSYGPEYDELMGKPEFRSRVSVISARRGAWKMIEQDRIDGLIADEVTGLMELQQLGLSDAVAETRVAVSKEPAMFAFAKSTNSREFVDSFDKVFTAMVADGRYLKIAQTYLPCPVSTKKLGCR